MTYVHPTAIVNPKARLGEGVQIDAFTIVHENVQIGPGARIGSHCELGVPTPLADGSPLSIGAGAHIRSHSLFYASSEFGDDLVTGHRVTVREGTRAGRNLQLGTLCDVQGDCAIGHYVRFHSNVHVGKHSRIGNFVWIFPYVVLTNDPTPPSEVQLGCTVGDYGAIATMSVVLPGVSIGAHALVAAHACVAHDVPPHTVAAGVPAKIVGEASRIVRRDGSGAPAYPWTLHFHRGYPEAVVAKWKQGIHEMPGLE